MDVSLLINHVVVEHIGRSVDLLRHFQILFILSVVCLLQMFQRQFLATQGTGLVLGQPLFQTLAVEVMATGRVPAVVQALKLDQTNNADFLAFLLKVLVPQFKRVLDLSKCVYRQVLVHQFESKRHLTSRRPPPSGRLLLLNLLLLVVNF